MRNKRKITRDTALNCCREDVLRWAGVFQSESPRAVALLTYRCSIRLIIADLQTEQEAEFEEVRRPMRRVRKMLRCPYVPYPMPFLSSSTGKFTLILFVLRTGLGCGCIEN